MEIKVLKKEPNFLEFIIKGERHTLPNLLKAKLSDDSSVTFVAYSLDHPMDSDSKFVLRTQGKQAKKVLTDACNALTKELSEFSSEIKKTLK